MITGGSIDGEAWTNSVVEYDIDADTYNPIQSLPDPRRCFRMEGALHTDL